MLKKVLVLVVIAVVAAAGIQYLRSREEVFRPLERSEIDQPEQLDDLHAELPTLDPEPWVRTFLPDATSLGFNLGLYRRRIPIIFDMNGRIVHSWPEVRASGRVRLGEDGRLAIIGTDNLVKEYDWNGTLMWYFQLPDERYFPHHDLIRLTNGNLLILAQDANTHTDFLWEVDSERRVVWEWWMYDHRREFLDWDFESTDSSHSNSIRELPNNRWFDAGDPRFRPGNILVSARNLNTIFIIDKTTGTVVWQFSKGLDRQHEAVMNEQGNRAEGLITVFNNGLENLYAYRRSLVQSINPVDDEVTLEYGSEFFFSAVGGTAQPLAGGNLLITSSNSGRAFEITSDGEIVWEWVPPFNPMRLERLPFDHCPQLAALTQPEASGGARQAETPYIDTGLYRFEFPFNSETRVVNGKPLKLLLSNRECRQLLIPPEASMRVHFGIDGENLGDRHMRARFAMTIDVDGSPSVILDKTLDSADKKLWIRRTIPLVTYAYKYVEMCLTAEIENKAEAEELAGLAVWATPVIDSPSQHPPRLQATNRTTEQERKLRNQQLRALGYIN